MEQDNQSPKVSRNNSTTKHLGQWIKLNVGGQIFNTTRSTLCIDHESMLAKMFSTDSGFSSSVQDENGAYLIDRDPRYFASVLNFLRTGKLIIEPSLSVEGIYEEAEYFQISSLIQLTHPQNRPDLTRQEIIIHRKTLKFEGLQLHSVDFSNFDLTKEIFNNAKLRKANFTFCDLSESSFVQVYAPEANFSSAKVKSANFNRANLSGAVFNNANVYGTVFRGANLENASFRETECTSAIFQDAFLKNVNFSGANLERAKFANSNLQNADLGKANISNSSFTGADLRGAIINWLSACPSFDFCTVNIRNCIMTSQEYDAIPLSLSLKGALGIVFKEKEEEIND